MPKRIFYFVVVCILGLKGEIFSQIDRANIAKNHFVTFSDSQRFMPKYTIYQWDKEANLYLTESNKRVYPQFFLSRSGKLSEIHSISKNYYSTHLGFFCQKELQMDKISIVPLRFRLGSLDYTNYLEQKPNANFLK